MFIAALRLTAQ